MENYIVTIIRQILLENNKVTIIEQLTIINDQILKWDYKWETRVRYDISKKLNFFWKEIDSKYIRNLVLQFDIYLLCAAITS